MQIRPWLLAGIGTHSKALNVAFKAFPAHPVPLASLYPLSGHTLANFLHLTFFNCSHAPGSRRPQCLCTGCSLCPMPPSTP